MKHSLNKVVPINKEFTVASTSQSDSTTSPDSTPRLAVSTYFTEFLVTKLHQPLLPKLRKVSASVRITVLQPEPSSWILTICAGMLESIHSGKEPAQCGFCLSAETFAAIAAGKLAPQMAFFKRQVEIEGNIALGLQLATVLAEFFRQHPYTIGRS